VNSYFPPTPNKKPQGQQPHKTKVRVSRSPKRGNNAPIPVNAKNGDDPSFRPKRDIPLPIIIIVVIITFVNTLIIIIKTVRLAHLRGGRRGAPRVDALLARLRGVQAVDVRAELDDLAQEIRRLLLPVCHCALGVGVAGCEGEVCEAIRDELRWTEVMGAREKGQYKYVLDVDNVGPSQDFRALMSTNALVFRSTLFAAEWYADRIQPWLHYVPVQLDYSDLYDALLFFGGDVSGEGAHDRLAREMGTAGREWVRRYWRGEDATAYMFRLWLEYARVMDPDRDNNYYRLPPDDL